MTDVNDTCHPMPDVSSGRSNAQNKNLDLQFIINGVTESADSHLKQIEDSIEVKKNFATGVSLRQHCNRCQTTLQKSQSPEQSKAKPSSYTYHNIQSPFPSELLYLKSLPAL